MSIYAYHTRTSSQKDGSLLVERIQTVQDGVGSPVGTRVVESVVIPVQERATVAQSLLSAGAIEADVCPDEKPGSLTLKVIQPNLNQGGAAAGFDLPRVEVVDEHGGTVGRLNVEDVSIEFVKSGWTTLHVSTGLFSFEGMGFEKEAAPSSQRCAMTTNGKQCERQRVDGEAFCRQHAESFVMPDFMRCGYEEDGVRCQDSRRIGFAFCEKHDDREEFPDALRCDYRIEGRRCVRRRSDGYSMCDPHLQKYLLENGEMPERATELPEVLQCVLSKCKNRRAEGYSFCLDHLGEKAGRKRG